MTKTYPSLNDLSKKKYLPKTVENSTSKAGLTGRALYDAMLKEAIAETAQYARLGTDQRQEVADTVLGGMTQRKTGDMKTWDWDTARRAQIDQATALDEFRNMGIFNTEDYAYNKAYVHLAGDDYLRSLLPILDDEIHASMQKDAEHQNRQSYRVNNWQAWSDMQNRLGEMNEGNAPYFWAYADYLLNGDQSTPFDMDTYDSAWNAMGDEEFYADQASKQKQFEGLDWATLTDKNASVSDELYESQTGALTGKKKTIENELARGDELAALKSSIRNDANYDSLSAFEDDYVAPERGLFNAYANETYIQGYDDLSRFMNSDASWAAKTVAAEYSPAVQKYLDMGYDYLTEDELADYNALFNAGRIEDAARYLELLGPDLLYRRAMVMKSYTDAKATNPWMAVPSWVEARIRNVENVFYLPQQIYEAATGTDNPYSSAYDAANKSAWTGEAQLGVIADMDTYDWVKKAAEYGYKGVTGVADNTMRLIAGGGNPTAALIIAGLQAGSGSLKESANRDDMSGAAKIVKAIGTAAMEVGTEKIGLDALFDTGRDGALSYIKNVIPSELGEETINYLSEDALEAVVGFLFDYEAEIKSGPEFWQGLTDTWITTALSAGVMGSGGAIGQHMGASSIGKAVKTQGDAESVLSIGESMNQDTASYAIAKDIREKLGKGGKISTYQLGRLTKQLEAELSEEQSRITNQVMDEAIEARLMELGDDAQTAKKNAPMVRKVSRGQESTAFERAAVNWNDNASQVVKELAREVKAEGDALRTGMKWQTNMTIQAAAQTADVRQRQAQLRDAVTTPKSEAVKAAEAKAERVTKGRKGTGKNLTATKVSYAEEGSAEKAGEFQRFVKDGSDLRMVIKTDDGEQTVSVADMIDAAGKGTATIIEYTTQAHNDMSAAEANSLMQTYQAIGGDAGQVIEKFDKVYAAGYAGTDMPAVAMDEGVRQAIYEQARKDGATAEEQRIQRTKAVRRSSKGAVTWLGKVTSNNQVTGAGSAEALSGALEGMTESQRSTVEGIQAIAQAAKVNIVLFESDLAGKEKIQNGSYHEGTNTIYLDINSGANDQQAASAAKKHGTLGYAMMRTLSHELTHYIEAGSAEGYANLKTAMKQLLKERGLDWAALVRSKLDNAAAQHIRLTRAGAEAEVIADASEYMLENSAAIEKLGKGLKDKVKGFVKDFLQRIRTALDRLVGGHAESRALRQQVDGVNRYVGELQRLWDVALEETVGAARSGAHAGAETNESSPHGKHYAAKHAGEQGPVSAPGKREYGMAARRAARMEQEAAVATDQSGEGTEMMEADEAVTIVQFSPRSEETAEKTTIKDQIRILQTQLNEMDVVSSVVAPNFNGVNEYRRKEWILNTLKSSGFKTDVQGFGIVEYGENQINQSLNYLDDPEEIAAFACIPRVLKRGIRTQGHENHKGRSYSTVTFAAPVEINGVRGNMAVVVKMVGKKLYKTHRVLMPDGSAFAFIDNEKTEPKPAGGIPSKKAQATHISSANSIVPQVAGNVNTEIRNSLRDGVEEPSVREYIGAKKRSLATPMDEQASINTPIASSGTASNNSLLQSSENVNRENQDQMSLRDGVEDTRFSPRERRSPQYPIGTNSISAEDVSYAALISKPHMQLTLLTDTVANSKDRKAVTSAGLQNAKGTGIPGASGMYAVYVSDIDGHVHVSRASLQHGLDRRADRNSLVTQHIGELLENAILINAVTPKVSTANNSYVLLSAGITPDGNMQAAKFIVNKFTHEVEDFDVLYSVDMKKSQPRITAGTGTTSVLSPADFTISIADLLDAVKNEFSDVLSNDVINHYGIARKTTEITANLKYSLRDLPGEESVREFIAESGDEVASNVEEKNALVIYRKRLEAYKAAVEETEAAEKARDDAIAQKGHDSADAAAAQNAVGIKRMHQKKAYNDLLRAEDTPHVKQVLDFARQFIHETLSGTAEDFANRQAEADAQLTELEAQYKELRAAGRTQMAAERKRSIELQQRYARIIKSRVAEGIQERRAEYERREANARDYRHIRDDVDKLRRSIGRKVKRLNALRVRETDQKHVPEELKPMVDAVMTVFTENAVSKLAFSNEQAARLSRTYDALRRQDIDETYYWDEEISETLKTLMDFVDEYNVLKVSPEGKTISYFTVEGVQMERLILTGVEDVVSNVLKMVDTDNEEFINGKKDTFEAFATQTGESLLQRKDAKLLKGWRGDAQKILDELLRTGNMTPVYFIEHLDNPLIQEVFDQIRRGQSDYAKIIAECQAFVQETKAKYHYGSWVGDGILTMETSQKDPETKKGHIITLTREQAMWVYATAKREESNKLYQTEHLLYGGFQYKDTRDIGEGKHRKTDTPHQLNKADIAKISDWLTNEQRAYADAMVKYLSTVMAEYGNDASMAMFGYKKFLESYYFPFKVRADQRYQRGDEGAGGEDAGTGRLKHASFTNKVQHKANQTLVMDDFTAVVADHMQRMATYSAMVQPVENLKRLLNHKVVEKDGGASTIRALIGRKYGQATQDYLTTLLKDLNGAAQGDERAMKFVNYLVSAFKRGAVMGSASVVLQQPTAIARAMSMVNLKYFMSNPFYRPSKGVWAEMMAHSGTAIIKDMGKFDVGMGLTASQYIADEHLGPIEAYRRLKAESKTKAGAAMFKSFMDWLTAAPGKADQWTFGLIWQAVKKETAELNPGMDTSSEAFLDLCGQRFDDVIDHTQVYDSVLTRSNLMRSRNAFHRMATSFMAEPTQSINMLYDAVRGWKTKKYSKAHAGAIVGSVLVSQVLAGVMAALVQAWDDDDDERNWLEKYADRATGNILDNINPLGMIPYVSDILSLCQGYDVERADMSILSTLIKYTTGFWNKLTNGETLTLKDWENFAGNWANLTGIPAKNILREVRRTVNAVTNTAWSAPNMTNVGYAMKENLGVFYSGKNAAYYERMVSAMLKGDEQLVEDYREYMLTSKMVSEEKLAEGLRSALKDEYQRGRLTKAQAQDFLLNNNLAEDKQRAFTYVDKWDEEWEGDGNENYNHSVYNSVRTAIDSGSKTEITAAIKELTDNGWAEESVATAVRSYVKDLYIENRMTQSQVRNMYKSYCLPTDFDPDDENDWYWLFKELDYYMQNGADASEWKKYGALYSATETGNNLKAVVQEYLDHGVEKGTLYNCITTYYKKKMKDLRDAGKRSELANLQTRILTAYQVLGYDRDKKLKDIQKWLE